MTKERRQQADKKKFVFLPRQIWRATRPIKEANGNLSPETFLTKNAETIKKAFPLSHFPKETPLSQILVGKTIPVIIGAHNELRGKNNNNICNTLQSLSIQVGVTLQPIVVDDGSTDGTGNAAETLGAYVIKKDVSSGLLDGYRSAFQALKEAGYTGPILITDADSAPLPQWALTMEKHAEDTIADGGEAFGRIFYYDGGKKPHAGKNFLLNVATFSRDTIYRALGKMIAHGPNGIIIPDPDGKIIDAIAEIKNPPSSETPIDVYVANTIKGLDLEVTFNNRLKSLSITSGRRYKRRKDVIKRGVRPKKVKERLYRENPI